MHRKSMKKLPTKNLRRAVAARPACIIAGRLAPSRLISAAINLSSQEALSFEAS